MLNHMERPLTQHFKKDNTWLSLKEYEKVGGYEGLRKALKLKPEEVSKMVEDSGLKGRGGAGFPTGKKWSLVPMGKDAPTPKYFVANADEMEPGSFKDRFLMENNPHQMIEGIIIGSYAIQAKYSYVFLRWAYHKAAKAIKIAIHKKPSY